MNNTICHVCGSGKITYYRQKIKGGRVYVTARCENGHSPVKGKPFFEQWRFTLEKLPFLNIDTEESQKQLSFSQPSISQPYRNFPFPVEEK